MSTSAGPGNGTERGTTGTVVAAPDEEVTPMSHRCAACGNEYARTFEVHFNGESFVFDSFECAINKLAPRCQHCGVTIVGHGVEAKGRIYCCAHCARGEGATAIRDHA
jgi:hypothetical protein